MFISNLFRNLSPLKITVDEGAYAPTRAHSTDAGLDIYSRVDQTIPARGSAIFDTGVHVQLPRGTAGFLKSKSGLNVKHSILSEGVIDVGYTGSIVVKLYNNGDKPFTINKGDKISQLVIVKCKFPVIKEVDFLKSSDRGDKGFGSTGN